MTQAELDALPEVSESIVLWQCDVQAPTSVVDEHGVTWSIGLYHSKVCKQRMQEYHEPGRVVFPDGRTMLLENNIKQDNVFCNHGEDGHEWKDLGISDDLASLQKRDRMKSHRPVRSLRRGK